MSSRTRRVGGDGYIPAVRDRPIVVDGELHLVALADVQCAPDLFWQRQLRLGADLYPGAEARLRLDLGGRHTHGDRFLSGKIFLLSHFITSPATASAKADSRLGRTRCRELRAVRQDPYRGRLPRPHARRAGSAAPRVPGWFRRRAPPTPAMGSRPRRCRSGRPIRPQHPPGRPCPTCRAALAWPPATVRIL